MRLYAGKSAAVEAGSGAQLSMEELQLGRVVS